jgi:hypothetical protein
VDDPNLSQAQLAELDEIHSEMSEIAKALMNEGDMWERQTLWKRYEELRKRYEAILPPAP